MTKAGRSKATSSRSVSPAPTSISPHSHPARRSAATTATSSSPAAPVPLPNDRMALIVLSQEANAGLGSSARYFLLATIATALLGVSSPRSSPGAGSLGRSSRSPRRRSRSPPASCRTRLPEPSAGETARDRRAGPQRELDGRGPRTLPSARAAVPAVGEPRPAHAAHVDPWICRQSATVRAIRRRRPM